MARKTPEERLRDLEQRRLEIERKAKEEKAQIAKAKRREQGMIQKQKRKDETRKKILVGSMYLDAMASDPAKLERLHERLDTFLTRDSDRALFGFDPLPEAKESDRQDNAQDLTLQS
jgi:hypothetical protein